MVHRRKAQRLLQLRGPPSSDLKEEEYFRPPKEFIAQANLKDPALVKKFNEKSFPECFDHYASLLDWDKPWRKTLDASNPPFWKWFIGGKLNACYNCVDRHLPI